jgi:hypothetical protein
MDCAVLTHVKIHEEDENVDKVLTGQVKMAALLRKAVTTFFECPVRKRQKAIVNKCQSSIQLISDNDYRIGF